MDIWIQCTWLGSDDDPLWDEQYYLYAYFQPQRDRLLYIGKADYSTIRSCWYGEHKDQLFEDIWRVYGIAEDEVRVLHGEVELEEGYRRSSELLADVESLLIKRLQSFGNVSATRTRIVRAGLRVPPPVSWEYLVADPPLSIHWLAVNRQANPTKQLPESGIGTQCIELRKYRQPTQPAGACLIRALQPLKGAVLVVEPGED